MNGRSSARRTQGHTLAEMLVVVALVAVLALVALPSLTPLEPNRMDFLAEEVSNHLRLAVHEARVRNAYVLVDGKTTPGELRLYLSTATAQIPPTSGTSALNDPLTKTAAKVQPTALSLARDVVLDPRFVGTGGLTWTQLLVGPGAKQFWAFDGTGVNKGSLAANSRVVINMGGQNMDVTFNELTGLVLRP